MANRRCIVSLENIRAGVELRGEDAYPAGIKGERINEEKTKEVEEKTRIIASQSDEILRLKEMLEKYEKMN